jgi:hypothetical protein
MPSRELHLIAYYARRRSLGSPGWDVVMCGPAWQPCPLHVIDRHAAMRCRWVLDMPRWTATIGTAPGRPPNSGALVVTSRRLLRRMHFVDAAPIDD